MQSKYYFLLIKLTEKNMNMSFFLDRMLGARRSHWVLVEAETGTFLESKELTYVVKTHKAANIL